MSGNLRNWGLYRCIVWCQCLRKILAFFTAVLTSCHFELGVEGSVEVLEQVNNKDSGAFDDFHDGPGDVLRSEVNSHLFRFVHIQRHITGSVPVCWPVHLLSCAAPPLPRSLGSGDTQDWRPGLHSKLR